MPAPSYKNQDYSLNLPGNGARPGSMAIAYLTGSRPFKPPGCDGRAQSDDPAPPWKPSPRSSRWEETSATVSFAGLCPRSGRVVQVNFVVPALAAGDYPLQINIGTAASNTGAMTVSQ